MSQRPGRAASHGDAFPAAADLQRRNRRVAGILVAILGALVVASLLLGIRW
jgi:phosphotransferase system  glucose/maltose/N-acetylglucosamine-specific IIC component